MHGTGGQNGPRPSQTTSSLGSCEDDSLAQSGFAKMEEGLARATRAENRKALFQADSCFIMMSGLRLEQDTYQLDDVCSLFRVPEQPYSI